MARTCLNCIEFDIYLPFVLCWLMNTSEIIVFFCFFLDRAVFVADPNSECPPGHVDVWRCPEKGCSTLVRLLFIKFYFSIFKFVF